MNAKQVQTIILARTDTRIETGIAEQIATARAARDAGQVTALLTASIGQEGTPLVFPQIMQPQETTRSVWILRDDRKPFPYMTFSDGSPDGEELSELNAVRMIGRTLNDGESIEVICTAMEGM